MAKTGCRVVDFANERLDPMAALDFVSEPGFGGVTMFIGRIRDHNQGRTVTAVSYDLFEALALKVFAEIVERAEQQWGPQLKLYLAHARGRLGIGDLAVVVAAGAPHRDEAFRACRMVIEAIKHAAPIWKQEHYADGDSAWSEGCSLCHSDAATAAAISGSETQSETASTTPPFGSASGHRHREN
ncbi:MAG: molybdopterin converting factor subunit 2 protein [Lysobacterales bacterium CG02_land_8_20_14_3_00_62_12]|nr:MAG: molybdopterin converting factor subunit 2 protein [Xanthomonadales bacterium CG02_land_8_20_14_3_00_62_12]